MADKYPEHEKLKGIQQESQFVGGFLEWASQQGYFLAERVENADYPDETVTVQVRKNIQQLLSEYHGIDLVKLENEKRKMLEEYREGT